ncbi:hypothetical protein [Microbulbifer sp.]|uniref:hypothetical protein n=1 Tax=Microbulbifer sp. TaxID=1908541 RepID=UPI00258B5028|nr:hypothetical protein [Microbulbifer sp.]
MINQLEIESDVRGSVVDKLVRHIAFCKPPKDGKSEDVLAPVLQLAVFKVNQRGKRTVTEYDFLWAVVKEGNSFASQLLVDKNFLEVIEAPNVTLSDAQERLNVIVAEYWGALNTKDRQPVIVEKTFRKMLSRAIQTLNKNQ